MSLLKRIKGSLQESLDDLARAFASDHLSVGYCTHCERETQWFVHLARGRCRCAECDRAPEQQS